LYGSNNKTPIISLHGYNWLGFMTEMEGV